MEADRMRRAYMILAASVGMLALAGSATFATTTMWLSTSAAGAAIPGNTITVASGASVTLYAFMQSIDMGNTFELMVGYDTSNAATYGGGTAANAVTGNLTLGCSQVDILASLPSGFNVYAAYPNAGVVLYASGREASDAYLEGRPFGFLARAATATTNSPPGTLLCFSFTLKNNMTTAGQSQYVVLSNSAGANSYSSAWKYGASLSQSSYSLNVVTGSLPTLGTSAKSLSDPIMFQMAPNYNWVLWGTVSQRTASSFVISDGSGVSVTVNAPNNAVEVGNYVSVRGTLTSTNPPTLTSQQINIYN